MAFAFDRIDPGTSRVIPSIADCRPELQSLHRLWDEMRGARSMPARADLDPARARHLLPHLMLVDVFAGAPPERRYRIRLFGTAQADRLKLDWTGFYLHDKAEKGAADRLAAAGDEVVASRRPRMSTGGLYWVPQDPYTRFESILLPLSDDDERVNMILGLTLFF